MKHCINCSYHYPVNLSTCVNCGASPQVIDGFESYAPKLAFASSGFKSKYFTDLFSIEKHNFWFIGRNKFIVWVLQKYIPNFKNFLEIGCGTGFVLSYINHFFPNSKYSGSEIYTKGLSFACKRVPNAHLMQMDACQIPYINEFDVIGAFDVLEHITEDEKVLQQINKALIPNGFVFISVPQHQWLWSAADDYACHVRRYTASDIHNKLIAANFEILFSSSFVTTLLPFMFFSRWIQKNNFIDYNPKAELKINPLLNKLFGLFLSFELYLLKIGLTLPFGGSRLILAKKIN